MTIQAKILSLIKRREVRKQMEKPKDTPVEKNEPKHQHTWKVIGKTYAPPTNLQITAELQGMITMDVATVQKSLFGVTTLLWECSSCGETKREELLGSDEDLLESVINKAEKIGPQFVQRRGKDFIISEWNPPASDPSKIPVR